MRIHSLLIWAVSSLICEDQSPCCLAGCQLPVTRFPQAHLFDLLFFPFKLLNGKITGITCIIQNNLPISKSLTLTKSAKSLLSVCKRHSQVLKTRESFCCLLYGLSWRKDNKLRYIHIAEYQLLTKEKEGTTDAHSNASKSQLHYAK